MAEIWIYDVIGEGVFFDGVTSKAVRDDLAAADPEEEIMVRINSPGGDVFEAQAIRTMLAQRKGPVNVQIDGVAASAASWIATVGTQVAMSDGAMLMIHNPWTVAVGDSRELAKAIDLLNKVGNQIATSYAERSGAKLAAVQAAMDHETWYTSKEAVEFGLADTVVATKAKAWAIPQELGYRNVPGQTRPPASQSGKLSIAARQRRLDLIKARQHTSR